MNIIGDPEEAPISLTASLSFGLQRETPKAGPDFSGITSEVCVIGLDAKESFLLWKDFLLGYEDEERQAEAPAWDVMTTTFLCVMRCLASKDIAKLIAVYTGGNYVPTRPVDAYVNFKQSYQAQQFHLHWVPDVSLGKSTIERCRTIVFVVDVRRLEESRKESKKFVSGYKQLFYVRPRGETLVAQQQQQQQQGSLKWSHGTFAKDAAWLPTIMESRLAPDPRACEGRPFNPMEQRNVVAPFKGTATASSTIYSKMAANEHASIGSFALFSMNLLACGAPLQLVRLAHQAAIDEVKHTRMSMDLAGGTLRPSRMTRGWTLSVSPSVTELALATVKEACINETMSLFQMKTRASEESDPETRATLEEIVQDELRHACLGFLAVKWALSEQLGLKDKVHALFRSHPSWRVLEPLVRWLFSSTSSSEELEKLLQAMILY